MAGPTRARSNIDSFVGEVARGAGLAAPGEFPVVLVTGEWRIVVSVIF